MVDVWLTRGAQGSGKSTWAREFCLETGAFQLEMDQYRIGFGFPAGSEQWSSKKENLAFKCMLDNLISLVKADQSVVLSNTHVSTDWPTRYKQELMHQDVTFHVKDFSEVPLDVCLERNSKREGLRNVPADIVRKAHKRLTAQNRQGDGVTVEFMRQKPFELRKYTGTPGRPPAILVDFDGTLALMSGRGPYEFWRVDEDLVNRQILTAVKMARAYGYKVIGCSGRDEGVAREKTLKWMTKHSIVLDGLVMRKAGDARRDDVVKHDLFFEYIADHYDVQWVYDDRNRVVDTWRAMGIQAWQVAKGDF